MENSKSKIEALKPVIIKAGIPLVVSLGCLLWAKFMSTTSIITDHSPPKEEDDDEEFRSMSQLLKEFGNLVKMEMVRVEILSRRVSSMEMENQRVGNMVMDYVKVLEEMELFKLESQVLKRKVKKLCRIVRHQSSSIRRSRRRLGAQEMEVCVDRRDREDERSVVKKLEDDVRELRQNLEQLQVDKNEILVKLNSAEASNQTNKNEEASAMEEYNDMVKELQQLQKEQAAEEEELDACLRHKLLLRSHHHHHIEEDEDREIQTTSADRPNNCLQLVVAEQQNGVISKRKKVMQKLRNWLEGSDHHHKPAKHRLENHEHDIVHARRSCSSA